MSSVNTSDLRRFVAEIVKRADLKTMSSRKIRALCERRFRTDLTSRKKEIDQIVLHFLHEEERKQEQEQERSSGDESSSESGSSSDGESEAESEEKSVSSPSHSSSSESCSDSESSSADEANPRSQQVVKGRPNPEKKMNGVPPKKNVRAKGKKIPVQAPKPRTTVKNSRKKNSALASSSAKDTGEVSRKDNSEASSSESVKAPAKVMRKGKGSQLRTEQMRASTSQKKDEPESELEDEMLARCLQAQEFSFRARTARKYTESLLKRNVEPAEPKKRKTSGYSRKCVLSPQLAELLKTKEMARHDIVKKMWSVVRERQLFDPSNKQFAFCDEQLHSIFGKKRIRLFGMMKYLKHHLKDLDSTV